MTEYLWPKDDPARLRYEGMCWYLEGHAGDVGYAELSDWTDEASADMTRPPMAMMYADVWGGQPIPALHPDRAPGRKMQMWPGAEQMLPWARGEQTYVYPGTFRVPADAGGKWRPRASAMRDVRAIVVDLDPRPSPAGDLSESYGGGNTALTLLQSIGGAPEALWPHYIAVTGAGLHLWYVLDRPWRLLSKEAPRREVVTGLIRALFAWWASRASVTFWRPDTASAAYCHAYRAPGSPTKRGWPTRVWRRGGWAGAAGVGPMALAEALGYELRPIDVADLHAEEYMRIKAERDARRSSEPATEKQLAWLSELAGWGCAAPPADGMSLADADAAIKAAEAIWRETGGERWCQTDAGRRVRLRRRDGGLYSYTLGRIRAGDSPAGTRYNALFALAGLAYNCGVPRSQLEEDTMALLHDPACAGWVRRKSLGDGKPLQAGDVRASWDGYCALGCLRPREATEHRLGWTYGPPQKRNGRSRKEHLWGDWVNAAGRRQVNTAKANRTYALADVSAASQPSAAKASAQARAERSCDKLAGWLAEHPAGTKRAAAAGTGMSINTVRKYWAAACEAAGVTDTRTGNHSPF